MKLAQTLFVLVVAARAVPAASLTDFFPPQTKVVIGIHVRSIRDSAGMQDLIAQSQTEGTAWLAQQLKIPSLANFDPLRDIDEVLLASTAEGQNPPCLIVVSGRFDLAILGKGASRYRDVPLLGATDASGVLALLDANTILAGDLALVRDAIDRRGQSSESDADLAARIASMRGRYDVWGLGDHLESLKPAQGTNGLDGIDRFQFGMAISHGMELTAEFHAKTAQAAQQISSTLQMLQLAMQAQPSGAATKFEMKSNNGTVTVSLAIPEAELKKAVQTHATSLPQASARQAAQPTIATRPATIAAPVYAAPASSKRAPAAAPQVIDSEGNTIILTLPGR